jgi:acetyl-CoA carboxylase alpha subunit
MMNICDKFMELHCDGSVYSDPYIVCGMGYIDGMSVLLIG